MISILHFSHRTITVIISFLALIFSGSIAPGQGKAPNIIFFYIDDLGWKDLGCYGSEFYETPAIDRLAEDGMRFTSAYQAAARCVPSRTSLFTGKYHERPGITDSQGVVLTEYTFAEAFREAGYHTFFAGKWHLGKDASRYPDQQGFDVNKAGCSWGAPQGSTAGGGEYFSPYGCPTLEDGPEGEYLTDRLTRETIDFINSHHAGSPSDPFLACVFHYAVHTPIEAPEKYVAPYREKLESMQYDLPLKEIDGPAKTNLRQDHAVYAGMIAAVDESVGRIRKAVSDLGLEEETIIIFSSDHGGLSTTLKSAGREIPTSNYPLRSGKGWLYEGGIRSPLIIRWPGVTEGGQVTDEVVVNMDLYPTMLEMAGLPLQPQQHLDGESFAPLVRGQAWKRTAPVMWYFPLAKTGTGNPNMAAVRVNDHKLIHFMLQDRFELYDLRNDWMESRNIAGEDSVLAEQLKSVLFSIQEETGMPPVSENRIRVEQEEVLPEYPLSISESSYPELALVEMEQLKEDSLIRFKLSTEEENEYVHPLDLSYAYRISGASEWMDIGQVEGAHHRLLPGVHENSWKYSGLEAGMVDIRIRAHINNALYPVKVGEVVVTDVELLGTPDHSGTVPVDGPESSISIFPVPSGKCVKVNSALPMEQIELFGINGRRAMEYSPVKGMEADLELSVMDPGVYLIRVTTRDQQIFTRQIIVDP